MGKDNALLVFNFFHLLSPSPTTIGLTLRFNYCFFFF